MSSPAASSSRIAASLAILGTLAAFDARADDFVATVVGVEGECFSRPNSSTDPRRLQAGMRLTAADQVLCNVKSSLKYQLASKKVLPLPAHWTQIGGTPIEHDDSGPPDKKSAHMQEASAKAAGTLQQELDKALESSVIVARLDPTSGFKPAAWTAAWPTTDFAPAPSVPDCGNTFAWAADPWPWKKSVYATMDGTFKFPGIGYGKLHPTGDWFMGSPVETGVFVDKVTLEKWSGLTGQIIKVDK